MSEVLDALPFDTVVLGSDGRRLTLAEFAALPLDRRIAAILSREIAFLRGDEPVDRGLALKWLMQAPRRPVAGQ
jgi:hypothetical protein